MAARVVRAAAFERALKVLEARGVQPAACDLLPDGAIRLHLTSPVAIESDHEAEAKAWDAALE